MGSCQNRGPSLGTLNNRCRIILGTQEGTIILTTTHIYIYIYVWYKEQKPTTQVTGLQAFRLVAQRFQVPKNHTPCQNTIPQNEYPKPMHLAIGSFGRLESVRASGFRV